MKYLVDCTSVGGSGILNFSWDEKFEYFFFIVGVLSVL